MAGIQHDPQAGFCGPPLLAGAAPETGKHPFDRSCHTSSRPPHPHPLACLPLCCLAGNRYVKHFRNIQAIQDYLAKSGGCFSCH